MGYQLPFIIIAIAEGVIGILLLFLSIRLSKKNKQYKELLLQYKKTTRENELDEKIKNEYYILNKADEDWNVVPYDVKFHDEKKVIKQDTICVNLCYEGKLATSRYMVDITDEVYIGRSRTNSITLNEDDIDEKHIRLIKQKNELYAQVISKTHMTKLKRGKDEYQLNDLPVRINDGDTLCFDKSTLRINMF